MIEKTPADALERINRVYHTRQLEQRFITMILLVLEPENGKLRLFNAGHDTPFLRRADGSVEEVGFGRHGFPIAMMPEINCREVVIDLKPRDAFVMMTDGIPNAADGDQELFGTARIRRYLEQTESASPAEIGKGLIAEVRRFAGDAPQADDQCVVVVGRGVR